MTRILSLLEVFEHNSNSERTSSFLLKRMISGLYSLGMLILSRG